MIEKTNDLIKQFLIIVLYIFIKVSLFLFFFLFFYKDLHSNNPVISDLTYITIDIIILIVFIYIFRKKLIPDFYNFKKNYKRLIKQNAKYWIIGLIIMVISTNIINFFIELPKNEIANRNLISTQPFFATFSVLIAAPIIEESMTRIILKKNFSKISFVLLSGLIFGSLHLISNKSLLELLYIIPYGTLGCMFALIYYKSNNIWTNIFFHFLHNFLSLALLFVGI